MVEWFRPLEKQRVKKYLCLIVGALAVVSLSVFGLFYWKNQSAAYFLMPTRLWELGTRCLLFIGLKESDTFKQRLIQPQLLPAAGAATLLFFPVEFAVPAAVAVVLLTALVDSLPSLGNNWLQRLCLSAGRVCWPDFLFALSLALGRPLT